MSLDPNTLLTVPMFKNGSTSPVMMTFQDLCNNVCLFNDQFVYKIKVPPFETNRPAYVWTIEPEDMEHCIYLMDWFPYPPS